MKEEDGFILFEPRSSMKYITDYVEIGGHSNKRMAEHISDTPIDGKNVVLSYLKNGTDAGVCCSSVYDHIKNQTTFDTIHRYTDGEYKWDDREIYHFEKYNLELDADFVKKVLSAHSEE